MENSSYIIQFCVTVLLLLTLLKQSKADKLAYEVKASVCVKCAHFDFDSDESMFMRVIFYVRLFGSISSTAGSAFAWVVNRTCCVVVLFFFSQSPVFFFALLEFRRIAFVLALVFGVFFVALFLLNRVYTVSPVCHSLVHDIFPFFCCYHILVSLAVHVCHVTVKSCLCFS